MAEEINFLKLIEEAPKIRFDQNKPKICPKCHKYSLYYWTDGEITCGNRKCDYRSKEII